MCILFRCKDGSIERRVG